MQGFRFLVVAIAVAASPIPAQEAAGAEAFAAGRQEVKELMAKGRWQQARRALLDLLSQHEGKDYVIRQRDSILEDHKRCSFYMTHAAPEPEDLVSGEVVSWRESSGKIKLRYTPDNLDDWQDQGNGCCCTRRPSPAPTPSPSRATAIRPTKRV